MKQWLYCICTLSLCDDATEFKNEVTSTLILRTLFCSWWDMGTRWYKSDLHILIIIT